MKADNIFKPYRYWKLFTTLFLIIVACSLTALFTGCSDDYEEPSHCEEGFGPEGAVLEVNDLTSQIKGVKITIPPGAVNDCANLWINENEFIYFPSGFNPFYGKYGFKLMSYNIPEDIDMKIQIPTSDLEPHPTKLLCAFYSDDPWDKWHIVLPDEITNDYITFNVSGYHSEWSWGLVDIIDVDPSYIEPLMIEINGEEEWSAIKIRIEALLDSIALDEVDFNCMILDGIYSGLSTTREHSENILIEYQSVFQDDCGHCDVTEVDFYVELIERLNLEVQFYFTKMLVMKSGNWKIKLLMACAAGPRLYQIYMDLKNIECNHVCFYRQWNTVFKENLIMYYVTSALQFAIEFAVDNGYVNCTLTGYPT